MKEFSVYQYVDGEPMTERDEKEIGSKFWNKGKWDNFVEPFLPSDCRERVFVDMGCNAGLFLEQAEKRGFERVVGVDSNHQAIQRAIRYKNRIGGNYELLQRDIENVIDQLPASDVTVLANTHYYFKKEDWIKYLTRLKEKTTRCIIVTADKKPNDKYAPSDIEGIRESFKDWNEPYSVLEPRLEGDPYPRRLWGLCFDSGVERVPIESLDNGNAQQRDFLEELADGIPVLKTHYYKRLADYRKRTGSKQEMWSDEKLVSYMMDRKDLFFDILKNDMKEPIIAKKTNRRIIDGNHRHEIERFLGHNTILVRWE